MHFSPDVIFVIKSGIGDVNGTCNAKRQSSR